MTNRTKNAWRATTIPNHCQFPLSQICHKQCYQFSCWSGLKLIRWPICPMFDIKDPFIIKGLGIMTKPPFPKLNLLPLGPTRPFTAIINLFRNCKGNTSSYEIVSSIIDEEKFSQLYDFMKHIWRISALYKNDHGNYCTLASP